MSVFYALDKATDSLRYAVIALIFILPGYVLAFLAERGIIGIQLAKILYIPLVIACIFCLIKCAILFVQSFREEKK